MGWRKIGVWIGTGAGAVGMWTIAGWICWEQEGWVKVDLGVLMGK